MSPQSQPGAEGPVLLAPGGAHRAAELCTPSSPRSFSQALWQRVEKSVFRKILAHPFISGLIDGTLPESSFACYIAQDMLYLREYSRALALVAAAAPRREWAALFSACSRDALQMELNFHKELLDLLGSGAAAALAAPSPNNLLYTSYLISTIHERPFHEGLAAVLPCFMVYRHVAKELTAKGSPHPLYQRWIDEYAGEEFEATVRKVEAMVDEVALELGPEELEKMHEQMLVGCRMEYLFWDGAYRNQEWPV